MPTVFVQRGNNLSLHLQTPVVLVDRDYLKWIFNKTLGIVRLFDDGYQRIRPIYKGRVFLQNHTLFLMNVQQSDGGDYTAIKCGDEADETVAEYKVIIQGRFL